MKKGAVMIADDLVLAMRSIHDMQNLLNNEQRKLYIIRKSTITVQIINSKYKSISAAQLLLNGNL